MADWLENPEGMFVYFAKDVSTFPVVRRLTRATDPLLSERDADEACLAESCMIRTGISPLDCDNQTRRANRT